MTENNTPYQQGKTAHRQGFNYEDNPHLPGSAEFESWINGWMDASAIEEMDLGEELF